MFDLISDSEMKKLRLKLDKFGRRKLIDRLKNEMINARLKGKDKKVQRLEQSIDWAIRSPSWID